MVELDDKMRMILWILLLVGGAVCIIVSISLFAAGALMATAGAAAGPGGTAIAAPYAAMYTVSAVIFLIIGIALIVLAILIWMEKLPPYNISI